jgi:hypothetical protein
MHRIRPGLRDAPLWSVILSAALLSGVPAAAAPRLLPDTTALTVALGCQIRDYKVVVITNTTGSTLPAGTRITYDTIRVPDRAHIVGTVTTGALAPGAIVQVGAWESYSCTAWTPRILVMAP